MRVEFEHAYGLGGLGETLAACRNKPTFGQFLGVFPVDREDPVGELNIMYLFKKSSPYNRGYSSAAISRNGLAAAGGSWSAKRCITRKGGSSRRW